MDVVGQFNLCCSSKIMFRMLYLYRIRPLNLKTVNSNRKLTAGAISLKSRNRKGSPRALCVKPVTGLLKLPQKRYSPPRPHGSVWSPAGRGQTSWLLFVMSNCDFVTFPYGILGQAWFLSFFLSLYTAWRSLSSIIGRCTLYTPGCRMKAYK